MDVVKEDVHRVGLIEEDARDRMRWWQVVFCIAAEGIRNPFNDSFNVYEKSHVKNPVNSYQNSRVLLIQIQFHH